MFAHFYWLDISQGVASVGTVQGAINPFFLPVISLTIIHCNFVFIADSTTESSYYFYCLTASTECYNLFSGRVPFGGPADHGELAEIVVCCEVSEEI